MGKGAYNKVEKYWNATKTAYVKNTATQVVVKAVFFHGLFGMMAGLPKRSWRCIQYANAGTRSSDSVNSAMFCASPSHE